jgi:hypothetical protein
MRPVWTEEQDNDDYKRPIMLNKKSAHSSRRARTESDTVCRCPRQVESCHSGARSCTLHRTSRNTCCPWSLLALRLRLSRQVYQVQH